jgi:hypothetical protein
MTINRNFQIKNGISVGNGGTILVSSGNSIGIGTTNPTSTLQVSGSVSATSFVGSGESLTNIPASAITNSFITISTSTGLTGGGTTSLGGTLVLSNTGVTSLISSGNGIAINGSTGALTLSTGATSSSIASTLVYRDTSGNFSAGTITAALNGNASTATTASIATRTANLITFDNSGSGSGSGATFNGSLAQTISYNTIGASPLAGSSSLTTTGTVTSGTWSASFGAVSGANLTNLTAGNLTGTIPSLVLGNSTVYVGTTAISLNRTSASQTLSGINIDGNAGTATTSTNVIGSASRVLYNSGTNTTTTSSNLTFDGTNLGVSGSVTANSFVKSGGTSSQFLKADGSVDNNTYLTSSGGDISTSGPINLNTVPFINTSTTISSNYTVTTTYNSLSVGPVTINNGIVVTVNSGAQWTIA